MFAKVKVLLITLVLLAVNNAVFAAGQEVLAEKLQAVKELRKVGDVKASNLAAFGILLEAKDSADYEIQAETHFEIGRNYMETNEYPPAQQHFETAILLFQEQNKEKRLADTYRQLGLTYRYLAEYGTALDYVYLALQIYQKQDNTPGISSAFNSLGVILEKMGQLQSATEYHQKSLEMNYTLNDQEGIASALYNIGDIRRRLGDLELAVAYFSDALEMDIASGNMKNVAYSKYKIGYVQKDLGQFESAQVNMSEAYELFQQIGAKRDSDWALSGLADLYRAQKNYDLAYSTIHEIIERTSEAGYVSLLVDAYYIAIQLAIETKDLDNADDMLDIAIAQAVENGEQSKESDLEALRVELAIAKGDYTNAFTALYKQKQLEDSMLNSQRLESIANLQAQTEFVRRAHQIELLEKEKALQDTRIEQQRQQRNFWIVVLLFFSLLVFMGYYRFIQVKTNRKLERLVSERTQALEHSKNELSKAYKTLEQISLTDKLTGLRNRRFLEENIHKEMQRVWREYNAFWFGKSSRPIHKDLIIFVIDVDNFKDVNDTYGHNSGDLVLHQLAKRMETVFRESDYLVRWGGEEFIAIARDTDRSKGKILAERMRWEVSNQRFNIGEKQSIDITCSIGFCAYPPSEHQKSEIGFEKWLEIADAALYQAKDSGRNRWIGVENFEAESAQYLFDGKATLGELEKAGRIQTEKM